MATYNESFESNFGQWVSSGRSGWVSRVGSTRSSFTGPSSAQSGNRYVYVETSFGGSYYNGDTDYLTFNMGSASSGSVNFWYHQYGSDQGTLTLQALVSGSWTNLWSSSGTQGTSWINRNINFTNATQIRFRNVADGGYRGDVALDNITVNYSPATVQTQAPSIIGVTPTTNSVTFALTNNDSSTATIRYEINDSTPDANTVSVSGGSTVLDRTLSGLSPDTTYTIYASAIASGESLSEVVSSVFTTDPPIPIRLGTQGIGSIFNGDSFVYRVYQGSNLLYSTSYTLYAFGNWTGYSNNNSCSESSPSCNSNTVGQVQRECRCVFGSWSSYSSVSSASASAPSCGQGVTQTEVQRRTRNCSQSASQRQRRDRTCNTVSNTTCDSCPTYDYVWGVETTTTQSSCPFNGSCGFTCSGGPSSCTSSTFGQTQWSCLQNPGFMGAPTTYTVTQKSCGRIQTGSVSCNCTTTSSCSCGSYGGWYNVSSCSTANGSGACSGTRVRDCRTLSGSCSCSGYSSWTNVSSCSRSTSCDREVDCRRRTRTGQLQERTRTCESQTIS